MHGTVLVAHSSFIEGSNTTKNMASVFIRLILFLIEQYVLDTNARKRLSYVVTDVYLTLVLKKVSYKFENTSLIKFYFWHHNTQPKGIYHNDTQQSKKNTILRLNDTQNNKTLEAAVLCLVLSYYFDYAKCCIFLLSVVKQIVVMLSVAAP